MNTISNLTNLKFFNDNGYELHSEIDYVIQWKLLPADSISKYFQDTMSGYFLMDIKYTSNSIKPEIDYNSIITGFTNNNNIYIDENYGELLIDYPEISINNYIKETFFNKDNKVELTIVANGKTYKHTVNVNYIFDQNNFTVSSQNVIVSKGENATDGTDITTTLNNSEEYYQLIGFDSLGLQYIVEKNGSTFEKTEMPILYLSFLLNIDNLALLYPFLHYKVVYRQDKVSEGFIAANTLLVLLKTNNTYHTPYLDSSAEHSILTFQSPEESEIKIFESDNYEIIYKDEKSYDLCDGDIHTVEPIVVNFGFTADEEGAYQNYIGMYIRTKYETNRTFFFGIIIVKTEVEGEDERFRTLLTNFGIPDPVKYSKIFAEADYEDDGKDYTLINKKSKELFLSYDKIFSYIGTYKALTNAIKFLGYNDIIFKEWYRIQDSNDQERDVAILVLDNEGNYIKNTLASYGVSIEDFERYNKLNKLTMVYHINQISDENEDEQTLYFMERDMNNKLVPTRTTKNCVNTYNTKRSIQNGQLLEETYFDVYDIPTTKPIFAYSTESVLAKLNSVKEWLEKHIIGVNAYIQEITGEGVYLYRMKNQVYVTEHFLQDFQTFGYYTPKMKVLLEFNNSGAVIGCTLNEYDTLTFDDYNDIVFEDFDKIDISTESIDYPEFDVSVFKLSNSIEAPILGNEYSFKINVTPESGTLNEYIISSLSSTNVYIADGEINILKNTVNTLSTDNELNVIFNHAYNIAIEIEVGNIRKCYTNWNDNIEWMIRETIDQDTGETYYELSNIGNKSTASHYIRSKKYITMLKTPNVMVTQNSLNKDKVSLYYTSKNKWGIPLFMFKGFVFNPLLLEGLSEEDKNIYNTYHTETAFDMDNNEVINTVYDDYILEIIKGRIIFSGYKVLDTDTTVTEHIATISFNDNPNLAELEIKVNYEYIISPVTITYSEIYDDTIASLISGRYYNNGAKAISLDVLTNTIFNSLNLLKTSDNPLSLNDYNTYKENEELLNDFRNFIEYQRIQADKKILYNILMNVYEENYTFNKYVPITVNHLGDYYGEVNVFNNYNHIFTNITKNSCNISALPVKYSFLLNLENSKNSKSFYQYNCNGELIDIDLLNNNIISNQENPIAPMVYRIYNIHHDYENNSILYDNISYAIDTPKNEDYLIISNLSEICTNTKTISNNMDETITTQLMMLDENPDKMNVYEPGTLIRICIYDNIMHKDVKISNTYKVDKSFKQKSETDKNYTDDSYLEFNSPLPGLFIKPYLNNINKGLYTAYIINVTEYPIYANNIVNDYDNNISIITYPDYNKKIFNKGDVIKVIYKKHPYYEELKQTSAILNGTPIINDSTNEKIGIISNEVCYRVIDTYVSEQNLYIELNGILDTLLMEQDDIETFISYPYNGSVHYAVKVIGDATEYTVNVGYKGYKTLKVKVNYNKNILFMSDYIDDTFSGYVYDFDLFEMNNLWFDATIFTDENIYKYHDFPITVEKGRHILVLPDYNDTVFENTIQYRWKWSSKVLLDNDNSDNFVNKLEDSIIMRSINNMLNISAEYEGVNNIELQAIDIYGNRLINKGEGKLYVKSES